MTLLQRLLNIDRRLDEIESDIGKHDCDLFRKEYSMILALNRGENKTKFYLKLNQFEKKVGLK